MKTMNKNINISILATLLGLLLSHQTFAATDCNAVTEIPVDECLSLLQLYNNTDGPGWRYQDDVPGDVWNTSKSPCSWEGVTCENNHVTRIDLGGSYSYDLKGTVPNFAMNNLTYLNLWHNQLTSVPDFSNLNNLTELNLNYNQLTSVPDFSNLNNLTELELGNNHQLTSVPDFSNLYNLTFLALHDNKLTSVPNFSSLNNLEWLGLSYNQLNSVPDFSHLKNLTYLYLRDNQLTRIQDFSSLTKLKYLDLTGNPSICKNRNVDYTSWAVKKTGPFTNSITWQEQLDSFPYYCGTPVAVFSLPASGVAPLTVTLNAEDSSDPDGTIVEHLWSSSDRQTLSGDSPQITFSTAGTYTISLTVKDNEGISSAPLQKTITVHAPNQKPTADFTFSPLQGEAPLTVNLDASRSTDDGLIVQFAWSLSDGRTLIGRNKELTFESAGTYEITLTVEDNEGLTHSTTRTVTVENAEVPNQSPKASFTLAPESGEEPLNVSATSTSTDPDGTIISYLWSANGTPFSTEQAVAGSGVPAGTYEVVLTVTDDKGATDSTGKTLIVTQKPEPVEIIPGDVTPGHAIIVAGTHSKDSLHPYTRKYTERMYKFLKMRGYTHDKIHYLGVAALDVDKPVGHPDTQHHDYKLFDPTKELEAAFATVAASLQAGEQFVFYFHGHGRIDNISVDTDRINATKLRYLLATLPAGSQQIIIFETCHGGSFLDDLKGVKNRIVVTSTDDKSLAFQVVNSSFSEKFIKMLEHGTSLREAFDAGATMIASHPKWFSGQRPWLDDDYDGVFLHDGLNSETIYIGKLKVNAAPPPRITEVHPYLTLTEDEGVLWVKVAEKPEDIHKVQAVLINPNYQLGEYIGEGTSFNRIEIDMLYNPAQNRYEALYDGFCKEPGLWTIRYEAQSIEGKWSEIKQGEVAAQNPCKQLSVEMLLNKSRYTQGEQILLNMKVGGNALVDLYVGLVYPAGYYVTIAHPFSFSAPETIKVHQANVQIEGNKTYQIMDFTVPSDFPKGSYQACGVLTNVGADPHDQANWLQIHCAGFEVY